jgi:anti-sigma regulatory factor (Ser/Thr protein kinase)
MSDPSGSPELELLLPPKPAYVRVARHAVAALATMHGLADELVDDVKLAVSEACTKAVLTNAEVQAEDGEPPPIVVAAAADGEGIEVTVLDRGADPQSEVSGSPVELSTEDLPFDRALSLPLIRGLVDDLQISQRDGGGSSVLMRLHVRTAIVE